MFLLCDVIDFHNWSLIVLVWSFVGIFFEERLVKGSKIFDCWRPSGNDVSIRCLVN